ncbi:hypothetical protein [Streptomyces sp. DSM 41634]|uniref:hypothetical protein n=1 Tax=Streptomyces sp. DSM 41634 TaxID=3448656 RepID=UPI00403FE957
MATGAMSTSRRCVSDRQHGVIVRRSARRAELVSYSSGDRAEGGDVEARAAGVVLLVRAR